MLKNQPRIGFALLAAATALFSGCVEAHVRTLLRYDKANDSFHCLQSYTNLFATDKKDLDHLEALWKRRAAVIPCPNEALLLVGDFQLFDTASIERKSKNRFSRIMMGTPPEKEPGITETQVDLEGIQVVPGEMYLNEHGHLCYYQQCVVPGKTLDAILAEVAPRLASELEQLAARQVKSAEKLKPMTWDAARKIILDDLEGKEKPEPPAKKEGAVPEDPPLPLDAESLRLLGKAVADKSVKLSRVRDQFTMVVPLSKPDSLEAIATVELIRKTVAERVKAGKPVEKGLPEMLAAVKLRHVEGAGLEAVLDLTLYGKAEMLTNGGEPDKGKKAGYLSTVAAMQARGVPIAKAGGIDKALADYKGK